MHRSAVITDDKKNIDKGRPVARLRIINESEKSLSVVQGPSPDDAATSPHPPQPCDAEK
jgi:hypothetical protein